MKEIRISVRNKIAMNLNNDTYVCDNSGYKVVFDFDAEWEEHPIKTARFKYNGMYQEVVFSGNTCAMPVIRDARLIYIGVYAGNLQTSTPAVVHASQSILSGDAAHEEPEEDVYNQLVKLVESGILQGPPGRDGIDGQDGAPGRDGIDGQDGAPGRDGADGKTPVYGVDYGTPEQIAGIAQQAAGILADDFKEISDGKVDKVEGKGLSTNDYDNAAKAKVDAIPENPHYTDTVYDDTEVKHGISQIKDDLSDKMPKSPANWEQWTAEEQAAARDRMNAQEKYRHIATLSVDEEGIVCVGINKDENGNRFNLQDICIYAYLAKNTYACTCAVGLNTKSTTINGSNNIIKTPEILSRSSTLEININKRTFWRASIISSVGVADENISASTGNSVVSHRGASVVRANEWDRVSSLSIACSAANGFGIGTKFDIWGR